MHQLWQIRLNSSFCDLEVVHDLNNPVDPHRTLHHDRSRGNEPLVNGFPEPQPTHGHWIDLRDPDADPARASNSQTGCDVTVSLVLLEPPSLGSSSLHGIIQ